MTVKENNQKAEDCAHGLSHRGDCCCNCISQLELRKHPWNKNFGKGSILESCGYVCIVSYEDGSNKGTAIYSDNKHGMCELHYRKNK